jgi:hypothetical protein
LNDQINDPTNDFGKVVITRLGRISIEAIMKQIITILIVLLLSAPNGLLAADAPTPEIRQSIIDGRARHLQGEIDNFNKKIGVLRGLLGGG